MDSDDLLDELLGSTSDDDDFLGLPLAKPAALRPAAKHQLLPKPARTSTGPAPAALKLETSTLAPAVAHVGEDSNSDSEDLLDTLLGSQPATGKQGPATAKAAVKHPCGGANAKVSSKWGPAEGVRGTWQISNPRI